MRIKNMTHARSHVIIQQRVCMLIRGNFEFYSHYFYIKIKMIKVMVDRKYYVSLLIIMKVMNEKKVMRK